MIVRRLFAMLALALAAAASAAAPSAARPDERYIGPIPATGAEAAETMIARQSLVIAELACGDEAHFLAKTRGKGDAQPWMHLVAKAAVLAGALSRRDFSCRHVQRFYAGDWDAELATIREAGTTWGSTQVDIDNLDREFDSGAYTQAFAQSLADVLAARIKTDLDALAAQVYGSDCEHVAQSVLAVPHPKSPADPGSRSYFEYVVEMGLSAACLERQINYVIAAPKVHRYGNPGTDKLPCVSQFGDAGHGDWDMAVAQLTRLAFFLRQVDAAGRLSPYGKVTMDKLQQRLLTLSGGPATEVYNLVFDCGNFDNSHGTARDRLDDNDFYDPDLGRTVEGDDDGDASFWEDLFELLIFLILLALLASAALGLAAMLGAIGGQVIVAAILAIAALTGVLQTVIGVVFGGGIEETENHLLMQNTSKYLKNKMLMEELYATGDDDGVEDYQDYNDDLREWLLERLQRITREDFAEYNAKPYGRLSVTAILNLHDFACDAGYRAIDPAAAWPQYCSEGDRDLVDAAASVLDLAAAKMALGSSQGRRFPPYRRLAHANTNFSIGVLQDNGGRSQPFRIKSFGGAADHMPAAMQLWTGQTFHGPGGHASAASLDEMIWHATSRYRPHAMILDLALDKSTPYQQTYHHDGWERYSSGPAWLLTAGGTTTDPAQGFRWLLGVQTSGLPGLFIKDTDHGAGVPTTLMVANGRRLSGSQGAPRPTPVASGWRADRLVDFIRFEGRLRTWPRDDKDEPRSYENNFCVNGSFACGINMHIPQELLDPYEIRLPDGSPAQETCAVSTSSGVSTPTGHQFYTIDSGACRYWDDGDPSNDFIAIVYRQQCGGNTPGCARNAYWGFLEIVPKSAWPDRAALVSRLLADNGVNFLDMARSGGAGELAYKSIANGELRFEPAGSYLTAIDGAAVDGDEPAWPRAEGVVRRDADKSERFTITHPRTGQQIVIDFSDQEEPSRVLP